MSATKAQAQFSESGLNGVRVTLSSGGNFVLEYDKFIPESSNMTLENFTTLSKKVDQVILGYFKQLSDEQTLRCAVAELVVSGLSKAEAA